MCLYTRKYVHMWHEHDSTGLSHFPRTYWCMSHTDMWTKRYKDIWTYVCTQQTQSNDQTKVCFQTRNVSEMEGLLTVKRIEHRGLGCVYDLITCSLHSHYTHTLTCITRGLHLHVSTCRCMSKVRSCCSPWPVQPWWKSLRIPLSYIICKIHGLLLTTLPKLKIVSLQLQIHINPVWTRNRSPPPSCEDHCDNLGPVTLSFGTLFWRSTGTVKKGSFCFWGTQGVSKTI